MLGGSGPDVVETSSDIPKRYRDFVDENLAIAGTIANRPYIPYAGQRIADFSPDTLSAFGLVRNLGNAYQPVLEQANKAYTMGMNSAADPSLMMSRYQNPYEDQVVASTLRDINEVYDRGGEQARLSSPFGGSRLALRESQNTLNNARAVADAAGGLRSRGFETAAQLGQNATSLMFGAGDRFSQLGQNVLGSGLQYADALAGSGQQQQGMDQARLDLQYGDFLDQLNYPLQALSIRQAALGQTPMGTVGRQPVTGGGSGMGGLLSGAGSLISGLATAGAFCWVAREAYDGDPKWLKVREWMLTKAPARIRDKYARLGPKIAEKLKTNPALKAEYREVFDGILEAA